MPIPICIHLPDFPVPFELTLPGGITIADINLMQMLQPVLTPLVPIFDIIDTVVALFNCLSALPEVLGPPPDPTIIAACIPQVAEQVAKLLKLLPLLSLPYTIVGILDVIAATLRDARTLILHLQTQIRQILGAIDRARDLADAGLFAVLQCAQANVETEAANVGKALASLGRLIGLLNMFMEMLGLQPLPPFSDLAGTSLEDAVEPISELIQSVEQVRDSIPLPY